MGHLPFEKWVFYGGFRVGHGSRVRRGVKQGPQEVMEKGTFGVRRWLCKVMFDGAIFSGVFGGGELGCFRFQRSGRISCVRVGTRKWLDKW